MPNILQQMLSKLTDNYKKDPSSNIGKLFNLVSSEFEEIETALITIEEYRDIDKAVGVTLDNAGKNVKQLRGQISDEIYRVLLKAKRKSNLSDGSIDTIIELVSFLLSIPFSDVVVTERWNGEPASLKVDVPAEAINRIGLSLDQFGQLLDKIAAGGVKTYSLFQGTFKFSSKYSESEYDPNKGFANLEQTTGGRLGAYYDPGSDRPLPL